MNVYIATILLVSLTSVNTQQNCVTFCNSLQILSGTCDRECPTAATTLRTTTTRRSNRRTTPSGCAGSGMTFCTSPNQTIATMATECANGTTPIRLTWTNLGTILTSGNSSGITNGTETASLASFFTNLGSMLGRAY